MSEERMMILAMLQEGKISSEEASKLIEALDEAEQREAENLENDYSASDNYNANNTTYDKDNFNKYEMPNEKTDNWSEEFSKKMESFGESFGKKMEDWGEDFGKKMELKGEDIEEWGNKFGEKMSKLGGELAEGATSLTDKVLDMVDSMMEKGTFNNFFGSYETITETLEKNLSQISEPNLEFEAINGKINVQTWDKEHIFVKATCYINKSTAEKYDHFYDIFEENSKVSFRPKHINNFSAKLEIYLPNNNYDKISLMTSNGKIQIKNISSKYLLCDTSNSSVNISNFTGQKLNVYTKNGKILLENINCNNTDAKTSNASIIFENINIEKINAITKNGKVILNKGTIETVDATTSNGTIDLEMLNSQYVKVRNSNGKIYCKDIATSNLKEIYLDTSNSSIDLFFEGKEAVFNISAETSMGHIDLEIPGLIYDLNNQKQLGRRKILAHSAEYTPGKNGINVTTLTSNGSIKIYN